MNTKELSLSGLLIALGLILPMVFHAFGGAGKIFLPMHLTVLVAGFLLSPLNALAVGMLTPFLSSVLTGMPVTFPMMPIMIVELGTYALVISLLNKKRIESIYLRLIVAMVTGRIMAGFMVFAMATTVGLKMKSIIFVQGSIITGLPGILIQLIMIPLIIKLLGQKAVLN
ncbi:MAG TPA: ECF transporter S component [Clostridia bacterium]|nr:ECF transporter S component [Clostridia bacterium]